MHECVIDPASQINPLTRLFNAPCPKWAIKVQIGIGEPAMVVGESKEAKIFSRLPKMQSLPKSRENSVLNSKEEEDLKPYQSLPANLKKRWLHG